MAYDRYTLASYRDLNMTDWKAKLIVKAKVRFKTAEEGGRINGVFSGYRPNHVFEYNKAGEMVEAFMGELIFTNPEKLELGHTYEILVRFPIVQRIEKFMEPSRKWWLHEGDRVYGKAEIIGFTNPGEMLDLASKEE